MNKSEFTNYMAEELGIKKSEAEIAIKRVVASIESALSKKESVNIMGFGAWNVVERKARDGHHPKTGEKIKIAAYNQPVFKVGKKLRDVCNPNKKK